VWVIRQRTRVSLLVLGIVLGILLVVAVASAYVYTEWLWFRQLGYVGVIWRVWLSRLWVGAAVGALYALFLGANLYWAQRQRYPGTQEAWGIPQLPPHFGLLVWVASAGVGFIAGLSSSGQWPVVLSYLNQVPFGLADPLFSRDAAFYVFSLPFFRLVYALASTLLVLSVLGSAVVYFLTGGLVGAGGRISRAARPGGTSRSWWPVTWC